MSIMGNLSFKHVLKPLAPIATLALFCVAPLWAENATSTTETDFFPHTPTTEKFNETWSYQFVFDNGTKAYVNYATLHVPTSGRKIGVDISFWNFKGKSYSVGRQYPPERMVTDKAGKKIDIKGEYALEKLPGNGHRVYFTAHKNGDFHLDLTFESAATGGKLASNTVKIGNDTFTEILHIPYGRVSGKIAYGNDTLEVKGYGLMEHSYQTAQAIDIARRVITFARNSSAEPFAGKVGIDKNGKPFGYAIKQKQILTPVKFTVDGADYNGEKFPKGKLEIEWNDSSKTAIDASKTQQKFSLLENFDGWLAKKAAKIMMGGEPFFYRGRTKDETGKNIDWSISGL